MPNRMTLCRAICILSLATLTAGAAHAIPAFPGAEGFGANATGGRGGEVYHVTSLADTDTIGTLRYGVTHASGPRTIVFDVGGYITIGSKLGVTRGNLTIAGQTAPGGGIGIRGQQTSLGASNLIIRHLRFRPGKAAGRVDSLNINPNADNTIVDHCSIEFSYDENDPIDGPENVTVQWSVNAWGLLDHSAGSLLTANDTTVHHTLWAHNNSRNPKARYGLLDWVNNVVFDWVDSPYICADTTNDTHWANVVGCYFISGASGYSKAFTSAKLDDLGQPTYHMYLYNTLTDFTRNGVLDGTDKGYSAVSGTVEQRPSAYAAPAVTTDDPLTAHKKVASKVGAWPRDDVDALLIDDLKTLHRRYISNQSELGLPNGGFGVLDPGLVVADSDRDGMSDAYETAIAGLQIAVPDHNGDINSNGYTNLEDYLNWLGEPHATTQRNQSIDIDLSQYTSGFATGATYTVSDPVLGGVVLLVDGHTARFTPTPDTLGLGGFRYTVDDGSSMSEVIGVLVTDISGPASLTWLGDDAANLWDSRASENWLDGAEVVDFGAGDAATFDDTGSASPTIQLVATLMPASVLVDADTDYTFGGSGKISGPASLSKSGTGLLTLQTANEYIGGTAIYEGAVAMVTNTSLGSGPVALAGGTLVMKGDRTLSPNVEMTADSRIVAEHNDTLSGTLTGEGTLDIETYSVFTIEKTLAGFLGIIRLSNSGMLRFNQGTATWGSDYILFDAGTSGTISNRRTGNSVTIRLGGLAGGADAVLQATQQPDSVYTDTYLVGSLSSETLFAGTIQDTAHKLALTKIGYGTLTLSGTGNFTGGLRAWTGTLIIDGQIYGGSLQVDSGGTLGGTGTVGGPVTVLSGAKVTPGHSVGTLTFAGNATLNSGTRLYFDVLTAANDRIHITGNASVAGTVNVVVPEILASGVYRLIDCDGQMTVGSLQLGPVPNGYHMSLDTQTPGQVNLVVELICGASFWNDYR